MNSQIYEEASEWLVELRTEDLDRSGRKRFQAWLSQSPEHIRAYLEVSGIWETISAQSPADPQDIDALIERARTTPANVLPLASAPAIPAREQHGRLRSRARRPALFAAAASLMLAILGMGGYLYIQRNTYTTGIGEQRSILLPDGSTINLNARSKIRVRLEEHERRIDLIEGQALFKVASDKKRPFTVAANGSRVRAVGTQFDVNQRRRAVIVTVVEGTVAVLLQEGRGQDFSPDAVDRRGHPGILVDAGQQVTLSPAVSTTRKTSPAITPQQADVDTATAWTRRRLIFDSTALEDVADEFNRNNVRPLVIEDAGLEDFHISGAFSSTDPEPLLRFLRAQTGIQVTEHNDRIVVSRSN